MPRESFLVKIEPDSEKSSEEFYGREQQDELSRLRRVQMDREFTSEEKKRFLFLSALEKEAQTGAAPLDETEHARYLELSKMDSYSPGQSAEFVALQERLDKSGRIEK